ncbi:MAG TPA: hypothetical protein D7H90_06660 [Candidatus Poseidoniales archaeon]|nr:MAG TPA: hypothetical protein D7H90_06660 [Candidatus Poseidoniales archaeon]
MPQESSTKALVSMLHVLGACLRQHVAFARREAWRQSGIDRWLKERVDTVQALRFLVPLGHAMSVLFVPYRKHQQPIGKASANPF